MPVTRIGEVQAKDGLVDDLRDFLTSILPGIQESEGCESVQLLQGADDPSMFVVIEVWESIEAHQASVKNIPAEKLGEIMPLLATSPSGSYFRLIHP